MAGQIITRNIYIKLCNSKIPSISRLLKHQKLSAFTAPNYCILALRSTCVLMPSSASAGRYEIFPSYKSTIGNTKSKSFQCSTPSSTVKFLNCFDSRYVANGRMFGILQKRTEVHGVFVAVVELKAQFVGRDTNAPTRSARLSASAFSFLQSQSFQSPRDDFRRSPACDEQKIQSTSQLYPPHAGKQAIQSSPARCRRAASCPQPAKCEFQRQLRFQSRVPPCSPGLDKIREREPAHVRSRKNKSAGRSIRKVSAYTEKFTPASASVGRWPAARRFVRFRDGNVPVPRLCARAARC